MEWVKKILSKKVTSKSGRHSKTDMFSAYDATREEAHIEHLCHAPYKSMLLTNNGRVLSCCFNRQAVIGTYPKQNLKEIWFGAEALKLRQYITNKDLSYGCFVCKNQLANGEYNTVKARMFDHMPTSEDGYPTIIEFDLDNTCNLGCAMCNADNSSTIRREEGVHKPIVSPYGKELVDELESFIPHLSQASFAGGEPFLIPLYYDIWEKIISINPEVHINISTNATVLNDKIKRLLEKGNFDISVSLDTVNKTTYESIRKNASFDEVMRNLEYFRAYCDRKGTYFAVWACPLRMNSKEIPDLFKYFGSEQIPVFLHTVWVPPSQTLWNLSSEALAELSLFYSNQTLSKETEIQKHNALRFEEYKTLIKVWETMGRRRENIPLIHNSIEEVEKYIEQELARLFKVRGYSAEDVTFRIESYNAKIKYIKETRTPDVYEKAITLLATYPSDFIFQIFEAGSKEMVSDFFLFLVR